MTSSDKMLSEIHLFLMNIQLKLINYISCSLKTYILLHTFTTFVAINWVQYNVSYSNDSEDISDQWDITAEISK